MFERLKDERYLEIWVEGLDDPYSSDMFELGKLMSNADIDWTQIWSDYSEHEVKQSFLYSVYHLLCGANMLNTIGRGERFEDNVDVRKMNFYLDNLKIRVVDTSRVEQERKSFAPKASAHLFLSPHNYEVL